MKIGQYVLLACVRKENSKVLKLAYYGRQGYILEGYRIIRFEERNIVQVGYVIVLAKLNSKVDKRFYSEYTNG